MASNFEFYSPTRVIFGKGTEQRVGALVREYGGRVHLAGLVDGCSTTNLVRRMGTDRS